MPEPLSPGQVAYAAYRQHLLPADWRRALDHWEGLLPHDHDAWEAAAQAVLDAAFGSAQRPEPPYGAPGQAPQEETPCT